MMPDDAFRILLSKRAAANLQSIFDFIAKDSPENAAIVVGRILNAIDSLKLFPHRTIITGQSSKIKNPIRSLPVQSYLVFFRVLDEHRIVRVLRIRHAARRRPKRYE